MTRNLVITEQAHADIERNAVWWAQNHSIEEAREWYGKVYERLESIPEMPASYALSPENSRFRIELREKNVGLGRGGYRAVFTTREEQIVVLAVRHFSRDALKPEDLQ